MKKLKLLIVLLSLTFASCSDNFVELSTAQSTKKIAVSNYTAEIIEIKQLTDTTFFVKAWTNMPRELIKKAKFEWQHSEMTVFWNSNSCCGNIFYTYIKKRDTSRNYSIRYCINEGELYSNIIPFEPNIKLQSINKIEEMNCVVKNSNIIKY